MTHDELLARISSLTCCSGAHELALRAVVELHKPQFNSYYELRGFKGCQGCEGIYPCPTIQAIEREIG